MFMLFGENRVQEAVYSSEPLSDTPATETSAKPTATVKSPVTALKPTCTPPVSSLGKVPPLIEPSASEMMYHLNQ